MKKEEFWVIIEECQRPNVNENREALIDALSNLSKGECVSFAEIWEHFYVKLNTYNLWAVADLFCFRKYSHKCSEDSFMDWRIWIIVSGKKVFTKALSCPDELLETILEHPNPGHYLYGGLLGDALEELGIAFEGQCEVSVPKGEFFELESSKEFLPKMFGWYAKEKTKY